MGGQERKRPQAGGQKAWLVTVSNYDELAQSTHEYSYSKGNKATLITRLQHDDERRAIPPASVTSQPVSRAVRHASTAEVPGIPSSAPSSPPPPAFAKDFLEVKLPDLSQPEPEILVQIVSLIVTRSHNFSAMCAVGHATHFDFCAVKPFVPDFWDSSRVKAESAPQASGSSTPKMIAVAGDATHHGGGPSHKVYVPSESPATGAQDATPASRPLTRDEARGVWVLLGLLAGSWLAAGYFKPRSALADAHGAEESATDTAAAH